MDPEMMTHSTGAHDATFLACSLSGGTGRHQRKVSPVAKWSPDDTDDPRARSRAVNARMRPDGPTGDQLTDLLGRIRAIALDRGANSAVAEDVAQESLARTLAVRSRLSADALAPYAVATARNLLTDLQRESELERRHLPRLLNPTETPDPETQLLSQEAAAAIRAALHHVKETDRALLLSHQEGASTSDLAAETGSTPPAIAARLNRIRARMRLDYVLALRKVRLPTPRCRPVLLAISANDGRRQRAIGVDRHLANCATCAALVPPLVERSSRLAGIAMAPFIALGATGGRLARAVRTPLGQAATAVSAAVVAGSCYAIVSAHDAHPATTATPARLPAPAPLLRTENGTRLLPVPTVTRLHALIGQRVIAADVPVQSVVSHPGFWVGTSPRDRLYVRIVDPQNVRRRVQRDVRLRFTGKLVANAPNFALTQAITLEEGASLLRAQGVHIEITSAALPGG
jgi:RNA polymerase sigma factor (sigma-70 family)